MAAPSRFSIENTKLFCMVSIVRHSGVIICNDFSTFLTSHVDHARTSEYDMGKRPHDLPNCWFRDLKAKLAFVFEHA